MGLGGSSKPLLFFLGRNLNRLDPEKKPMLKQVPDLLNHFSTHRSKAKKQADGKNFILLSLFFPGLLTKLYIRSYLRYCIIVHWHPCPWMPLRHHVKCLLRRRLHFYFICSSTVTYNEDNALLRNFYNECILQMETYTKILN